MRAAFELIYAFVMTNAYANTLHYVTLCVWRIVQL